MIEIPNYPVLTSLVVPPAGYVNELVFGSGGKLLPAEGGQRVVSDGVHIKPGTHSTMYGYPHTYEGTLAEFLPQFLPSSNYIMRMRLWFPPEPLPDSTVEMHLQLPGVAGAFHIRRESDGDIWISGSSSPLGFEPKELRVTIIDGVSATWEVHGANEGELAEEVSSLDGSNPVAAGSMYIAMYNGGTAASLNYGYSTIDFWEEGLPPGTFITSLDIYNKRQTELYVANALASMDTGGAVDSVNGQTGEVELTKADIGGLENVDNTSDEDKPVSTAQAAADATKVPLDSINVRAGSGSNFAGGPEDGRVALGAGATAGSGQAVAVGAGTQATGNQSTAVGLGAGARGDKAVAIGAGAQVAEDAEFGVAVGNNAYVGDPGSVAVGKAAYSGGVDQAVVGSNTSAGENLGATILGANAEVWAENGVAIGEGAINLDANSALVYADKLVVQPRTPDVASELVLYAPNGVAWPLSLNDDGEIQGVGGVGGADYSTTISGTDTQSAFPIPAHFEIWSVTFSGAGRLRLYRTSSGRAADAGRGIGVPYPGGRGLVYGNYVGGAAVDDLAPINDYRGTGESYLYWRIDGGPVTISLQIRET